MTVAQAVAAVMFAGVAMYGVFGGADFGTGLWDLTAGNARRGPQVRSLIDHSIGPVWEANHVWLIFVLVFLWTGFPGVFTAIATTLFIPLSLSLLGIVLRGAAFAFRKYAATLPTARVFGVIFATSSLLAPFFLGVTAGAIASGRVPAKGNGDLLTSWAHPAALAAGVLAVSTSALLASVFLAAEAARTQDQGLADSVRQRAVAASVTTGVVALGTALLTATDSAAFRSLTVPAAGFVAASALCGVATIAALLARRVRLARWTVVAAAVAILVGWAAAQWPALLPGQANIDAISGAPATMIGLLVAAGVAVAVVVPAMIYLLHMTQSPSWVMHTEGEQLETQH